MKPLLTILIIFKLVLLLIGGGLIWYGVSLFNIPASYIVLGSYFVIMGFPNKPESKKVDSNDNR